ncbi:acylphosphatase [Vibrio campbellii]|nr:acylphosphatase [Vibrio campbellii]
MIACGTEEQIAAFSAWLEEGPRTATVDSVTQESVSYKPFRGFKIL